MKFRVASEISPVSLTVGISPEEVEMVVDVGSSGTADLRSTDGMSPANAEPEIAQQRATVNTNRFMDVAPVTEF